MNKGTRFGLAASEDAWKAKEAEALHKLHAAGVRVPQPVMFYEGVLLMELVLDAEGRPAPRLVDAAIPAHSAAGYYVDLRQQMVKMLSCDLIHGDLSPYNVLLAWNGPTVIDFPQVVGAAHNSQAEHFFQRDLHSIRRFLASLDPKLHGSAQDAREIWRAYERRELTPDFVPTGTVREPSHPGARHAGGGAPDTRGRHRGSPRAPERPRQAHAGQARARPGSPQRSGGAPHGAPAPDRSGQPRRSEPRTAPPQAAAHPQDPGHPLGKRRRRRRHRRSG
jgi:RIO kinase 1